MEKVAQQLQYFFLSALLGAALFVMQPTEIKEVVTFQKDIQTKFAQSFVQLVGQQNFVEPFEFVWTGVSDFYSQSTDVAIAMISPSEETLAMMLRFDSQYHKDVETIKTAFVPRGFMSEEPIYYMVPVSDAESLLDPYFSEDNNYARQGLVAGESITGDQPDPAPATWLNVPDSISGQIYCVGIFDGSVNVYAGTCAYDDIKKSYEN